MAKGSKSKNGFGGIITKISLMLGAVLVVGMGAGLVAGHEWMVSRVAHAKAVPAKLVIDWPPLSGGGGGGGRGGGANSKPGTWLPKNTQFEITALTQLALSDDPYDHGALERAAQAVLSTGWVKRVASVRREPGGIVHVSAEWRTPAAVVRSSDRDYLVSAEGELLPMTFKPGLSGLRAILNPSYPPPAQPGEKWLGGDVQAGLALLGQLQTNPKIYKQVAGIDVERYAHARKLAAVTDKRNLVVWGVPPGESRVGEPSTARKMALLLTLLSDAAYGKRIDANQPVVDLTSPRGILIDASARPMSLPGPSPAGDAEGSDERPVSDSIATGQRREED